MLEGVSGGGADADRGDGPITTASQAPNERTIASRGGDGTAYRVIETTNLSIDSRQRWAVDHPPPRAERLACCGEVSSESRAKSR